MTARKTRALLVIMDGLGDRPVPELDGQTPLEAARKPHLDAFAREGSCGIMDILAPGIPVASDKAHLVLLGYGDEKYYPGRGPLESLGVGLRLENGDVALRGNLATIDEDGIIVDRRAGRDIPEAREIVDAMNEAVNGIEPGLSIEFRHSSEQRVATVIRGPGLSPAITATNPKRNGVKVLCCEAKEDTPEARRTANVVNRVTRVVIDALRDHPANKARKARGAPPVNAILFHGAGTPARVPTMKEKHDLDVACVAGNGLIKGVCRYLGIKVIDCPGATGTIHTDLRAKVNAVLDNLDQYDLVFLHVKATDSTGHDNKPLKKRDFIERVDTEIFGILRGALEIERDFLFVTADHSTPCEIGDHSGDPVPLLIWGPTCIGDDVENFYEGAVAEGFLSRVNGSCFINLILNKLDKLDKFGA